MEYGSENVNIDSSCGSSEVSEAAELEAQRRAEAEAELKEIEAEIAAMETAQNNLNDNVLSEFKPDGNQLTVGNVGNEETTSGNSLSMPSSVEAYDDAITSLERYISNEDSLIERINEFNNKYGDLNISSETVENSYSKMTSSSESNNAVLNQLYGYRELINETNQSQAGLFDGNQAETFGDKGVTFKVLGASTVNPEKAGDEDRVYSEDQKKIIEDELNNRYASGEIDDLEYNKFMRELWYDSKIPEGFSLEQITESEDTYADNRETIISYLDEKKYDYQIDEEKNIIIFRDSTKDESMKICGAVPINVDGEMDVIFAWPGEGDTKWTFDGNQYSEINGMKETIDGITDSCGSVMVVLSSNCNDYDSALKFADEITESLDVDFGHVVTEGHSNGFAAATEAAVKITESNPDAKVTICLLDSNPGNSDKLNKYLENVQKMSNNPNVDYICTTVNGTPMESKFRELTTVDNTVIYVNYNSKYSAYNASLTGKETFGPITTHPLDINHIQDYAALALGTKAYEGLADEKNIEEVILFASGENGRIKAPIDTLEHAAETANIVNEYNKQKKIDENSFNTNATTNEEEITTTTASESPTKMPETLFENNNGAKVTDDNGRKKFAFSQHVQYDSDGNVIKGSSTDDGKEFAGAWDAEYWEEYGKDEMARRNNLGGVSEASTKDPEHPCGFWAEDRTIDTSGCSTAASSSAIATIYGSTVTPDGKEISPVEMMSLYNSAKSNQGGFADIITDYYGLDTATDIRFGQTVNGTSCLDNLLENGGAVVKSINGGDHYIAITDTKYEDGSRYYFVVDSDKSTDAVGRWVNADAKQGETPNWWEWNSISTSHGTTVMIAPPNTNIYDACGLPHNTTSM